MEEKEKKLILQICPTLRVFDNEQKIDEINAENLSNTIFQEKVLWKKELIVMGFEPSQPKWLMTKTSALDHSATLPRHNGEVNVNWLLHKICVR